MEKIRISIENPDWRQWIIIKTANFLLWLIIRRFKNDEKKITNEIKDIVLLVRKALR